MWADSTAHEEETIQTFAEQANISVIEAEAFIDFRNAMKNRMSIGKSLEAIVSVCSSDVNWRF